MPVERIPPQTFDALYRFYKFNFKPETCLNHLVCGRVYESAKIADPETKKHFADIVLFIHECADRMPSTNELFDLRWEAWRIRFSPDATEIEFNRGSEE